MCYKYNSYMHYVCMHNDKNNCIYIYMPYIYNNDELIINVLVMYLLDKLLLI